MARIKRGIVSKRKHKKVFALTKGYRGSRNRLIRTAKTAALQAGEYAFKGRKLRKRNFRSLWISRISEAVKKHEISYSGFAHKLKDSKILLDRKILSDLIVKDPETFNKLVEMMKSN